MEKRKKRQLTEEKILKIALDLFAENGYSATSTSLIAKKASISEGTIFKYFPTKKKLLLAVITKFINEYGENLIISPFASNYENYKDKEFDEVLKIVIKERVELFFKLNSQMRVTIVEMQYHEELKNLIVDKLSKPILDIGCNFIDDYIKRGILRDVDSFVVIRSIMGAVMLMVIQKLYAPNLINNGLDIEKEIDLIVDIFMNGLKKN